MRDCNDDRKDPRDWVDRISTKIVCNCPQSIVVCNPTQSNREME